MTETEIQNAIRVELSKLGIVRRNNVGKFLTNYGQYIAIGLPGEPDLTLFARGGKTYFIEVKTHSGRLRVNQRVFREAVTDLGFEYIILRSKRAAQEFVERVKKK